MILGCWWYTFRFKNHDIFDESPLRNLHGGPASFWPNFRWGFLRDYIIFLFLVFFVAKVWIYSRDSARFRGYSSTFIFGVRHSRDRCNKSFRTILGPFWCFSYALYGNRKNTRRVPILLIPKNLIQLGWPATDSEVILVSRPRHLLPYSNFIQFN